MVGPNVAAASLTIGTDVGGSQESTALRGAPPA